ncbi:MAG TPA: imidazole glycerol phosphate synthase subunit HisH [bacterium]|nr:imidazole glycerol phosphate synthase subunit HisH [bacterium]HPN42142.1 imidazole glycerol phosphate synthase subunit HisH [bacterium]
MIVIIDYGMGNLHSIQYKLKKLGVETIVTADSDIISQADKIVLPGVGHFAKGMQNLHTLGLIDILNYKVIKENTPVLGICLGMQLLTDFSEEGNAKGLGWIKGKTVRFNFNHYPEQLKVPHIGWNTLNLKKTNPLINKIDEENLFYFVHSYYVQCENAKDIVATTTYGIEFHSVIHSNNIFGTQFHPEKSHDCGMVMLKNFIMLD